jgi:serine/threonine-protein kinase HipA
MEGVSNANESAAILCNSERYLHNLVITSDPSRIDELPIDHLHGRLRDHIDRHAVFSGQMVGVPDVDENFVVAIKTLMKRRTMPVISGYQPKMPMHLSESGQMWPAEHDAFTHILKFPGVEKDKYFARGAIEWASMLLARAGGVDTCDFAITTLSDGSVAYLAERFDIPESAADNRLIIAEDFNSIKGKSPYTASVGTLEYAWNVLSENSTNFEADAEALFRHICATIILENGDLHLKNMSVVKVASPNLAQFTSVRLSPSYDIMNTKFFGDAPKDTNTIEPLTMSLNNKYSDITSDDLLDYAEGLDIDRLRADEILHSVASGIALKAAELYDDLPEVVNNQELLRMFARMTCMRAISQVNALAPEALKYEPNSASTQRSRPRP